MSKRNIDIKLGLDDKQFRSKMKASLSKTERETKSTAESMKTSFSGAKASALAAAAAVVAIAAAVGALVKAYAKQEEAEFAVAAAMKTTGQYSEANLEAYKKMASALQDQSTRGDEDILKTMNILMRFGGVTQQNMERAVKATMDWASALGKDLNSAALDVAKALGGNVMMLQRYGVHIDKSAVETRGAVAVFEALEKAVGGSEEAFSKTVTGGMQQVSNLAGDLKEKIGKLVLILGAKATGSDTLSGSLTDTKDLLTDLNKAMSRFNEEASKGGTGANSLANHLQDAYNQVKILNPGLRIMVGLLQKIRSYGQYTEAGASGVLKRNTDFPTPGEGETFQDQVNTGMKEGIRLSEQMGQAALDYDNAIKAIVADTDAWMERTRGAGSQVSGISAMPGVDMSAIGVNPADAEKAQEYAQLQADAANMVAGAWANASSTVVEAMYDMVAAHKFSAGAIAGAMGEMVRVAVKQIAMESATRALFELAMGFASMWLNPAAAAAHFTAASMFGTIAGGAFLAGAVVGAPSSGGGGSYAGTSAGGPSGGTENATPEVISGYAGSVGSSAAPTVVINNIVDPNSYIGAMATPQGQNVIKNTIALDYYANGNTRQVIRGGR